MIDESAPLVNFNDTSLAFQARTNARLKRDYWLFKRIDSPFLTKIGPPMIRMAFNLNLPITGLVKKTLFGLFCGGVSIEDTVTKSEELARFNVKTILDYSVEGEKSESGFDATAEEIKETILHGAKHEEVVFSACKLTGMADVDLLGKIQLGESLSDAEKKSYQLTRTRIQSIAATASEQKNPIFIDAEDYWVQRPIDEIAESLMEIYNRETPIVHTTVQLYRHDRLEYLRGLIERSRKKGYILGVKLVRGAYLEKEISLAEEKGYPNPIQPNKEATDLDFNAALKMCVDHVDHVAVCNATHNEYSSQYLTHLISERGLAPNHPHIWFAQLLGMSDHISFNLAHANYNVAKYLPYGPVKAVLPYLLRRAEENTAIAGQSSREVELLRKEIRRRSRL